MKHHVQKTGEGVTISLAGEIDLDASPALRELLLQQVEAAAVVHVELSGVSYIDSSGIATLVEAFQAARRQQASFALVRLSEPVSRVLELARLDRVFTVLEGDGGT